MNARHTWFPHEHCKLPPLLGLFPALRFPSVLSTGLYCIIFLLSVSSNRKYTGATLGPNSFLAHHMHSVNMDGIINELDLCFYLPTSRS